MSRPAAPGPVKLTRPPFERMSRIHERLQERRFPNCSSLARALEVSTKTVQRDIDFMRDRLGLPIEFDPARNGYGYTRPVEHLPLATITEGELVALLVAQKAIEQYKGTSFEAPLSRAFAKLAGSLDGPVTVALGSAQSAVTFRPIGVGLADLELFRKLSKAVFDSVEITFDYRSLHRDAPERRRVQPWHLCCVENQWYVIGRDLVREAKRTFALPRIGALKLLRRRFVRPEDFSIQDHLGGSFGIFTGAGEHVIRLRFSGWAGRYVRERFWHESQRFTDGPDGTVELELRLNSLEEVERWILSFGEQIEVLAPDELRRRVGDVGRKIAARHA